jgi:hypothetical protein
MAQHQMSFISEVTEDIGAAERKFMGPTYPYYKKIQSPSALGMNGNGNLPQLGRNIAGLTDYVEVLVTGQGRGSTTGRPLGNKFFLKTAGTCKDIKTKKIVPRDIYINNVPNGNIPIISSAMGTDFSTFKGLVPGSMSNLNGLNPMGFIAAFGQGSQPACRALSMETVDNNDVRGQETHFVADSDIRQMDACDWGARGVNPVSNDRCTETFQLIDGDDNDPTKLSKDPIVQMYFTILGLGIIYIIYHAFILRRM